MVKKQPVTITSSKPKQLQLRQQEKKNRDEAKLVRDVNILRNLLINDFTAILPPIQGQLTALHAAYRANFKFLIISIIDIIHDAHHSRDGDVHCYNLPLFKLVVCNIFGITYDLYNYILKNVIPVSQSVLIRLLQITPGISGMLAQHYFTQQATSQGAPPVQPRPINCTIVRDNVGLGQTLTAHILQLGFQIVYAQTPCMVLDAVSVPNPNYGELNNYIATDTVPRKIVTNMLFPGDVAITASGSNVPPNNYNVRFEYNAPANAAANAPANAGLLAAAAAAVVAANHAPAAAAVAGILPMVAADIARYAVTPAATTPDFDIAFPWNPTSNPLVGYKPVSCQNLTATLELNPNPITASPSNTPKNCAFRLAVSAGAVGGPGIGRLVSPNPQNQQAVEQIIDANARLYIEYNRVATLAGGGLVPAGFQNLTLQQYILFKLAGDFSYCLYVIALYLTFVSTSDIISGLRLSLLGINLIFSMAAGFMVFYRAITMNTLAQQVIAQYTPMVLNLISRKCNVDKKKVVKRLCIKKKIPINKQIKFPRQSPRLAGVPPVPGLGNGGRQSGGMTRSSFDRMLLEAVDNYSFNTDPSPQIKPVDNPKISPENLKLLVSVLKMQFNLFREQLENFKKGGTFFIASGSTVDYKSSCTTIIKYLNAIFDIMSSEEFISYFTTNCSGKSYEECIKSMSSYVLMFPFIFDTDTNSWYLNYTYPFSVCLNEYILSLLSLSDSESKYPIIINFVSKLKPNLKPNSESNSPITPLESLSTLLDYGKIMPFNNAVTFVLLYECIKNSTQREFKEQLKLYNEQSELLLKEFDDNSLREFFLKQLSPLNKNGDDTSEVKVTSDDTSEVEDTVDDTEYFKEVDEFFKNFVVDNNILYEDFVKELVSFLIQSNNIIREGVFSVIKFILLFQNFDNIALCSYTVIKTIIEAFLNREYSSKSFAAINNEFNRLFYYNNLDIFFQDVRKVSDKIKETRIKEGLTSIDQLSILEKNISVQVDLYSYCEDYALSKFYDELYDDSIDSGHTFETTDDEYIDFQMKKLQEFINKEVDKYLSYDEIEEEEEEEEEEQLQLGQQQEQLREPQQQFNPLGLQHVVPEGEAVTVGTGGKNNPKSKHKAKYRKKYKKFVSKYIIKKKKKQNKNKNKSTTSISTKNKTKKNKRLTKTKHGSKSKYAKKTLKNKKRKSKSKSSNNKSKHNKKANTNYYNLYKHNKTLKH